MDLVAKIKKARDAHDNYYNQIIHVKEDLGSTLDDYRQSFAYLQSRERIDNLQFGYRLIGQAYTSGKLWLTDVKGAFIVSNFSMNF